MTVKQFLAGPIGTNCYLLINEKTKEAVIVDPASCPDYMMNYIKTEELKLKAVLLTHAHFDHIMGIDDVLNKYGKMPVYVHEADKPMLEDPQQNMTMYCGFPYAYKGAQAVQDGQVLSLIGYEIKVLHTPGHTPGGCCYYIASEHVLISGDTLFQQSIGRTDFPGGSMSDLVRAVKEKLMILPEDTVVYPGHMGTTTIADEKRMNPFL